MTAFTWSVTNDQNGVTVVLRQDNVPIETERFSETDNARAKELAQAWIRSKLKQLGAM